MQLYIVIFSKKWASISLVGIIFRVLETWEMVQNKTNYLECSHCVISRVSLVCCDYSTRETSKGLRHRVRLDVLG